MTPQLRVGDCLRVSVVLLEQLWTDESLDRMMLVQVRDIITNPDRTKLLILERAEMPTRES